jgi:GNAT superfamily N-acetyltransferase
VNIHDFFVAPAQRSTGISRMLFAAIEHRARELGCCKLTLEVLENNHRARRVYAAAGFAPPVHAPGTGGSLFLAKPL